MSDTPNEPLLNESTDRAVAARLGKLRAMPVDLTRLKAAVEREIPRLPHAPHLPRARWLTPLRAIAATFLIALVATLAIVLATSGRPAMASAERMAAVHASMASMAKTVNSLSEAEALLKSQWPAQPGLPGDLPSEAPMACCVHKLDGKQLSCVAMDLQGSRVSIAVGRTDDFKLPPGGRQTINGHEYVIESAGGINMVMTRTGDRWVCIMSSLPTDVLVRFAEDVVW